MKRLSAALFAAVLMTPALAAITMDQVDIAATVGSGSNQAICVVDFGGTNSFAFAYQWNDGATVSRPAAAEDAAPYMAGGMTVGANTIEAMLLALETASGLTISYHYDYCSLFVTGVSYQGSSMVDAYYTTGEGLCLWQSGHAGYLQTDYDEFYNPIGSTWIDAMTPDGVTWVQSYESTASVLSDGYFIGWTPVNWLTGEGLENTPRTPVVPEPTTMSLLTLAALGLLKRRTARSR